MSTWAGMGSNKLDLHQSELADVSQLWSGKWVAALVLELKNTGGKQGFLTQHMLKCLHNCHATAGWCLAGPVLASSWRVTVQMLSPHQPAQRVTAVALGNFALLFLLSEIQVEFPETILPSVLFWPPLFCNFHEQSWNHDCNQIFSLVFSKQREQNKKFLVLREDGWQKGGSKQQSKMQRGRNSS